MIDHKKLLAFFILLTMLSSFLAGCQSSPNEISGVVDTQAHAQKWEYKTLAICKSPTGPFGYCSWTDSETNFQEDGDTDALNKLNELGLEGWELVGINYTAGLPQALLIFKRPLD